MNRNDPIGRGIITPFRRDAKRDFANADGLEALDANIRQLLCTIGPVGNSPGEIPWATDRGTQLMRLRHRPLHSSMVHAEADMISVDALLREEPRVRAISTQVTVNSDDTLTIRVTYEPRMTNARPRTVQVTTNGR